jgi:hypothetical protein
MKLLKGIKTGAGYIWAVFCLVIVLATFVGLGFWSKTLATETGIHVSPRFTGGEVRTTIDHGAYRTLLHRPVFDGLMGERRDGFVQIDWVPQQKNSLPPALEEAFDIDGNGSEDCIVRLEGGKAVLLSHAPWVLDCEPVVDVDSEQILRLRLRNPNI